jgi:hypothetical protein
MESGKPKQSGERSPKLHADERTLSILEGLARINATHAEAAEFLGVSQEIFKQFIAKHKNAKSAFGSGKARAKVSLRRAQFQAAANGDVAMLIWLGKQCLGQSDGPVTRKSKSCAGDITHFKLEFTAAPADASGSRK